LARRLIELMRSEDERVAAVACNSILDRAFGRPRIGGEEKDDFVARLEAMTPEERVEHSRQLIAEGRKHLPAYEEWSAKRRREG
jgi:predicted ThiF/HesA family dinucleotide-utilizing enzyme